MVPGVRLAQQSTIWELKKDLEPGAASDGLSRSMIGDVVVGDHHFLALLIFGEVAEQRVTLFWIGHEEPLVFGKVPEQQISPLWI